MTGKQLIFGVILIFLGAFFLLQSLDLIWVTFGELVRFVFPVGLIALGAWLIVKKRREEQANRMVDPGPTVNESINLSFGRTTEPPRADSTASASSSAYAQSGSQASHEAGRTKYSNLFGDLKCDCENIDMRNVEVSGFMGDTEVILSRATLEKGLSRVVISGFIGDVRILVPRGMAVFANGSNFIGDVDMFGRRASGFGNNIDGQTANYATAESKLYIAINTFIGDIKIYEV